ncbi:MAG: hypothetical protein ABI488_07415 [Polyangiaceae bacterium]
MNSASTYREISKMIDHSTAPDQPKGVTVTVLLDLYHKAVATVGASRVTYQDLENAANASNPNFGAWLHTRALAHAVN